jgi:hypothetical protein
MWNMLRIRLKINDSLEIMVNKIILFQITPLAIGSMRPHDGVAPSMNCISHQVFIFSNKHLIVAEHLYYAN